MLGHTLKVMLEHDTVCLSIECHESDSAWCHKACMECDDVCINPDTHIKPINFCLVLEWIQAENNIAELYAGENRQLPLADSMPIDVVWSGYEERWKWKSTDTPWREDSEIPEAVNS